MRKEKLFLKLVEALNECVVIVEGKKDETALKEIGVTSEILHFAGSPSNFVERLRASLESETQRVVLLLDYDEEGERKAGFLREVLSGEGFRLRNELRTLLKRLLGVRTIEEVPSAWRRLSDDVERTSKN
jgi:5S rRNA maturation endonuclease (ribonuclease M5)